MLLEGIFLPLTTPFHADGNLFVSKLRYNVERYTRTPAAGLVMLSALGEPDALTDEETKSVLSGAIEAAVVEKVMLAAIGRESVFATLQLAKFAAAAGYDAVVVRGPAFVTDPEMRVEVETYFRAVADGVPIPIVLASEHGRTILADSIAMLAEHPNVLGLIDSDRARVVNLKARTSAVSRDVTVTPVFTAATRRMLKSSLEALTANLGGVAVLEARPGLKTRLKKVGFQILTQDSAAMLPSWQLGASGSLSNVGACAPQACCEVWQAFKDGDQPLAEEKQERVRALVTRLDGVQGIAAMKHGADFNGYYGGRPRLPLLGLSAAQRGMVEQELSGMRN